MRSGWQKADVKTISKNQIRFMCQMVFGSDEYSDLEIFTAGRSHSNQRLTLPNGQQVVLRVSDKKPNLEKQYALAQKLWQKLPVPRFINAPLEANGRKYFCFLEYRRGERLANIETMSAHDQAQLGFELGEYLALLHSQKFDQAGDFDNRLKISETYDISSNGLCQFFTKSLNKAVRLDRLSQNAAQQYCKIYAEKISIFNQWQHYHCLIHADLNEDNILHHDGHISAILDWEFVMSGHPALDFGKFTRTPYINCPLFLENLCDSYYLTHKSLPTNWDDIAILVDLIAWAEFLSRDQAPPDVIESALQKLNILN